MDAQRTVGTAVDMAQARPLVDRCPEGLAAGRTLGTIAPAAGRSDQRTVAPVNILYLLDECDGVRGGTEAQLVQLVDALDPARYTPHVWVLRDTPNFVETPFAGRAKVLGVEKLASMRGLTRLISMSCAIRRAGIRLVHIFLNDSAVVGPLFAKLGGAKVVASRRDLGFWYTPATLAALRISNHFVDRFVANSEQVRHSVATREGVRPEWITVIHNGHDSRRFDAPPLRRFREMHGIGARDPIIGMVANLHRLKRHRDLIKAFARVRARYPAAHLVLAGTGAEEASLRALTRSLGLERWIHFLGFVRDVVPVLKHFDICVLCSETEGLSNAVIEYLACGKPTVCTRVGGNTELIRNGVDGFLVEVGDVEALAERLIRILDDPALAARLGNEARRNPLATFSARDMAEAYMHLYDDLLGV